MRVKAWTILIKLCEQPRVHHSNLKLSRWMVKWCKGQSIERWSGRWLWNDINQQKWALGVGFKRKTPKGLAKWGRGRGACILNGMHLNSKIKLVGVKVSNAWCHEPCPKMLNYVSMVNTICWACFNILFPRMVVGVVKRKLGHGIKSSSEMGLPNEIIIPRGVTQGKC